MNRQPTSNYSAIIFVVNSSVTVGLDIDVGPNKKCDYYRNQNELDKGRFPAGVREFSSMNFL